MLEEEEEEMWEIAHLYTGWLNDLDRKVSESVIDRQADSCL